LGQGRRQLGAHCMRATGGPPHTRHRGGGPSEGLYRPLLIGARAWRRAGACTDARGEGCGSVSSAWGPHLLTCSASLPPQPPCLSSTSDGTVCVCARAQVDQTGFSKMLEDSDCQGDKANIWARIIQLRKKRAGQSGRPGDSRR